LKTEVGTSPARASAADVTPRAARRKAEGHRLWRVASRRLYDGAMITLYDNAFSPFARKVRLALVWKGIAHEVVDGLALVNRDGLAAVNGRVEVPALDHDGLIVVGSADIVAYLERVWPDRGLYPAERAAWVHARAWERCADTLIDPILTNVSYWRWAVREDCLPEGVLEAAQRELAMVYAALERDLAESDFVSGAVPSVADVALFPHLTATRAIGVGYDAARFPRLHAWLKRLRAMEVFADDLRRTAAFMAGIADSDRYERRKIFWRGDRIEWMLAHGQHGWLMEEIVAGRVLWPGPGIPAPRLAARGSG
jgi:glutathione S-transferase